MSYTREIQALKKGLFADAKEASIPVSDSDGNSIGKLVPIGEWIFDDKDTIEQICKWRQKAMRFFLHQFDSTVVRTESYLR